MRRATAETTVSVETDAVLAGRIHTALTGAMTSPGRQRVPPARLFTLLVFESVSGQFAPNGHALVICPCPHERKVRGENIGHSAFYPGRQLGLY